MIAKLVTFVSSLVAGASLLFGGASGLSIPTTQTGTPEPGQQPQETPQVDSSTQGADLLQTSVAPQEQFARRGMRLGLRERLRQPDPGDEMVRYGLVLAAVSATGLSPVDVLSALDGGGSIADIAGSAGKPAEDILAAYDDTVEYFFNRAVENGELPEELAQNRIAWYQEAGRQMVNQPGLKPPFPGLHQLHQAIIMAAVQVGDLNRDQIREGLQDCRSLEDILAENGHTGQEAVDYAVERISSLLDRGVEAGKLTGAQSEAWLASITSALEEMVRTPGLQISGRQCSN